MPRRMKISYFRGYKSLVFYARAEDLWIMKFRDFLDLPKFMGVHRIALPQTNRSVSEVEEALAYAWAPSFENTSMTPGRVQIIKFGQTWDVFSSDGSPLVTILYILPLDALPSSALARSRMSAQNWSFYAELPKVAPPSAEVFWQRLGEKGFTQPIGNIFRSAAPYSVPYYLSDNTSSPGFFETDRLLSDLSAMVMESRKFYNCSEEGKANVKIHLAAFEPAVAIYRFNGSFSALTVLPFSFVPAIKYKVFARMLPLNGLGDFPERYYKFDRHFYDIRMGVKSGIKSLLSRPFTRAYSFRMYIDRPMSIQLLPELEKLMWERLHANTTKVTCTGVP
ncbi:uncharacterized protein LOC129581989 [Paramacrobiotus metropolitanus]|uniref:uncharacterized protein LOC129581989 n=1 Tax=Paramacrobiotus metropolitanus TaxID=2943436 RepID=UPI002445EC49|nr:uncharacterized protein LOC129581989 [Paramacrobiotus metropolitanus]